MQSPISTSRFYLIGLITLMLSIANIFASHFAMAQQSMPTPPSVTTEASSDGFMHYTLPVGSPLHVFLETPIHTKANQSGDPITATLINTLYLNETVLLDKNCKLTGLIQRLEPPIQGRNAVVQVHFNQIKLTNGETLPISAYIKTLLPDHSFGGELTPGTKPKAVVHKVWGIGEYNKIVMAGPREMGNHIEFLPGERWTLILEQPLTLTQTQSEED